MENTIRPPLLNVKDVCKCLGLSHPSVYRLINSGQLASLKIGRRRKITREALDDFIRRSGGLPQ